MAKIFRTSRQYLQWSNANLSGRNFSHQSLQGACFKKARSGTRLVGRLLSYLLAHVLGHLLGFVAALIGFYLLTPGMATRFTGIGSLIILMTLWVMLWKRGLGRAVAVVTGMVIIYGTVAGIVSIALRPIGVSESTLLLASTFTLLVGGMIGAIAAYAGSQLVIGRGATVLMIVGLVINLLVVPTSDRSDIARTIGQANELGLLTTSILAAGLTGLCWHISQLVLADSQQHRLLKRLAIAWSSIGNTCFYKADLTGANFAGASLKGADFRAAKLDYVNWRGATGLQWVRWGEGQLSDPKVVELLTRDQDREANYSNADLSFTDLEGADLSYLNLVGANFTGAVLRCANLEGAILRDVRAVGTDFTGARFTGACIENWSIDASTKLGQVDCRFVFLRESPEPGTNDRNRQPASGEFEPGDFTRLHQTIIDTFELIFRDGINWKTFQAALEDIKRANPSANLNMQSVETKGEGYIVVKLTADSGEDKAQLYQELQKTYADLSALEGRYQQLFNEQKSQTQELSAITEQLSQGILRPTTPTGQSAIIILPEGTLETGFTVCAQLWDADGYLVRTQVGALPGNPELAETYRRWQSLYYAQQPLFHDGFDVDVPTNFSLSEFSSVTQQVLEQMNNWLQTPEFLTIDQCLRACLDPYQEATITWQVDDIAFQQLPLHHWRLFDDYPNLALTFSFLNTQVIARFKVERLKRRVLSVLGISDGLDLKADKKILESIEDVEIRFLIEPTAQDLHEALWDEEGWDIFCFSGHTEDQGDRICINDQESLSLQELRYALRKAAKNGLQVSILNCCKGLKLAKQLTDISEFSVIAMREPVTDEIAHEFLKYLAKGLKNKKAAHAFREAHEQLSGVVKNVSSESWLPILYDKARTQRDS